LIRLYRHYPRVRRADNPDAYAQKILTRCWLTERRRAWWRRERTTDTVAQVAPAQAQDERESTSPGGRPVSTVITPGTSRNSPPMITVRVGLGPHRLMKVWIVNLDETGPGDTHLLTAAEIVEILDLVVAQIR
jgi:hypothetical protein